MIIDFNSNPNFNNRNNKFIYPILYINLDRSNDRRKCLEKEFKKYHVKYKRIRAIDGKELVDVNTENESDKQSDEELDEQNPLFSCETNSSLESDKQSDKKLDKQNPLFSCETDSRSIINSTNPTNPINPINWTSSIDNGSIMEIACILSHLKAIKYAYTKGLNVAIIMEDDTAISNIDKWPVTYEMVCANAPKKWDIIQMLVSNDEILLKGLYLIENRLKQYSNIVYMNGNRHNNKIWSPYLSEKNYISHHNRPKYYSTGCYIINRRAMKAILNKYYDKKNDTFNLFGSIAVADVLLYTDMNTYYYTVPTVHTYDKKFNSIILNSQNECGLIATEIIEMYYENKPFICLI